METVIKRPFKEEVPFWAGRYGPYYAGNGEGKGTSLSLASAFASGCLTSSCLLQFLCLLLTEHLLCARLFMYIDSANPHPWRMRALRLRQAHHRTWPVRGVRDILHGGSRERGKMSWDEAAEADRQPRACKTIILVERMNTLVLSSTKHRGYHSLHFST